MQSAKKGYRFRSSMISSGVSLRGSLMIVSALACVVLILCYTMRPDNFTALTVFPIWIWPAPGLFLLGLAWFRSSELRALGRGRAA